MSITTETRRASHEEIKPKKVLRRQQILEAIMERGPSTVDELMDHFGFFDPNRIRPRLTELKDLGAVAVIGKRESRRSGKLVAVWAIREAPPSAAPCNEQKRPAPVPETPKAG